MSTLNWSDDMNLGIAAMDTVHREFVDLLAETEAASDTQLVPLWRRLVEHTQSHFDAEDRYMTASHFFATDCHSTHHRMVLQALRDGLAQGERGILAPIRELTRELAAWFPQHADTMDTALAGHMQRVGFDPARDDAGQPAPRPADSTHGCGGCGAAGCGPA